MYIYYVNPTINVSHTTACYCYYVYTHAQSSCLYCYCMCLILLHTTAYMCLILLYTTAVIYTHNIAAHADVGLRARGSTAFSCRRIR